MNNCEQCDKEIEETLNLCPDCYDFLYCECGRRLCEEEGSSPGDGLCRKCD